MKDQDDDTSSGPCFAHMLVDGLVVDPETATDVARFRKAERTRLYDRRKVVPLHERKRMAAIISQGLSNELGNVSGSTIAVYWPIRGELDLRNWMGEIHSGGAIVALPVVVEHQQPVEFHKWTPLSTMQRGAWNIPVPAVIEAVIPDFIVIPLLGVDENRFRLGNGGGYYDRTLVRMPPDTHTIGIGHSFSKMKSIFPMPWDIPMNRIILSDGTAF